MKNFNVRVKRKLASYFKAKLGMFDYRNGWMKGNCPMCGKSLKFGVNIDQNRTNCFSCGIHPRPIDLVVEIEGLRNVQEVWGIVSNLEDADYLQPALDVLQRKNVVLPESYKVLAVGSGKIADIARNYMIRRGFDINKLSLRGIGYCTKGEYKYRIVIPYYQQNKLIYYTTRQFINLGSKFKNPSVEEFGVGKSTLIYNIDCLAIYDKVRMVESATNALTLGDNALGIGGKALSNYQLSVVVRSPVKKVEIILDPDAYNYALKAALKLVLHKQVKVSLLPKGKDVNDIGRKATNIISKRTRWFKNYNDVLKEYLNCEKTAEFTYHRR